MSSVNKEFSRRIKEEKIARRERINALKEGREVKEETVLVRARNEDGTLKGDDPSTPDVNEAWVEKKVTKLKTTKKASTKKKKVGRPTKKA